jgi:threonine dehydrogenase-like Zn-dependent dehydrogenase
MAPLGVLGLIGAATPKGELPLLDMVLKNQLVFGTVNTSPEAFRRGIEDLASLDAAITGALIERVRFSDFERTMLGPPGNAVKLVHRVIE